MQPLPAEAIDLIGQGRKIEAIKVVRERLGLSLKDAKTAVESHRASSASHEQPARELLMSGETLSALRKGRLVDAVKHVRRQNNMGLKEAKDAIDAYLISNPSLLAQYTDAVNQGRHRLVGKLVTILVVSGAFYYAYRYFFTQ